MPASNSPFNTSLGTPIPGFSIDLQFDETQTANPVQMYSSIIFMTYNSLRNAWEDAVADEYMYTSPRWTLEMHCIPNVRSRQLKAMHVFHALGDIGRTVATRSRFFF